VRISEFPTTKLAAAAAHQAGLVVAAGAPNIVRGGSHSGNVAASELAGEHLLDIITSDYVPYSLLHAPFVLAAAGIRTLPEAVAMVSENAARSIGLLDRGRIAAGRRADLVRVRLNSTIPVVRSVYCQARRVG
jgi:alpha-D-ribose 1-methylphosphonate 5-triphosphate diphosphatase